MKTFAFSLTLALCIGSLSAQPAETNSTAAAPGTRPVPARARSPQIGPDRRVTFALVAPKAEEVVLSGEFMKGSTNLEKGALGVWSVTVGPLEPEIYHYNFTIDGVRTIDPGNPAVKSGSTSSTIASILEVHGDRPTFYDPQPVPHGEIRAHWYESKSLNSTRRLTVYTPPGYDKYPSVRYPVLYLLHGANANEDAWHELGRVNHILDNLIAAKKAKPFLVVMPFGYGVPPGASNAPGQNTIQFSKDLLEDVVPYIESHYRVHTDRGQRAIVGLSMGGGQALNIGLAHPERFSHIGGFSSGLGRAEDWPATYASLIANPDAANKKLKLIWIGCGTEDGAFRASKNFSAFLGEHKIRHTFRETDGAHTWIVWRRYLHEVAPLLFQ